MGKIPAGRFLSNALSTSAGGASVSTSTLGKLWDGHSCPSNAIPRHQSLGYPRHEAVGNFFHYMALGDSMQETATSIMKLLLITLVVAVTITSLLVAVDHSPGLHSTPGIWLSAPSLPGLLAVSWAHELDSKNAIWNDGPLLWFVCGFADWIAYFGLAKGAILLRRRFVR